MRIYTHHRLEDGELCWLVDGQSDYSFFKTQLDASAPTKAWVPPNVQIYGEDEGKALKPSDSPWMSSHTLVLRPRAVQSVGHLLARDCELLPVNCDDAELVLVHAYRVVDALDETASRVRRFRSSGRINWIDDYVFRPDIVRDVDIFRLASTPVGGKIYFSQRVVDAWEAAGLTGIVWREVWSLPLH